MVSLDLESLDLETVKPRAFYPIGNGYLRAVWNSFVSSCPIGSDFSIASCEHRRVSEGDPKLLKAYGLLRALGSTVSDDTISTAYVYGIC